MRASLVAVVLALGCRDKAAPKPAPATDAANALTVAFGADETKLTWGIANYRPTGLEIRLATARITCDDSPNGGTQLVFSVPPGPEGKFYVGSPIGIGVEIARAGKPTHVPSDETTLALEPFTPLVANAHVKGKLVAATHADGANVLANGTFDVEVCKAPATPIRALRGVAPTMPAAGSFETTKLEPKTAHAIVKTRAQRGPYVDRIVFYAAADVPCPTADKDTDALFVVTSFATRKTPTPAEATFGRVTFDAWVAFENAAFDAGERIKGVIWAQSAFEWESKGEFGGTFDALVCPI